MAEFNRRKLLIAGGIGTAGLLSGAVALTLPDMLDAARDRPLPAGSGILVILTLYGGNDGINTVVPYADEGYAKHRKVLRLTKDRLVKVDDHVGLHPSLQGLGKLLAGLSDDELAGLLAGHRALRVARAEIIAKAHIEEVDDMVRRAKAGPR